MINNYFEMTYKLDSKDWKILYQLDIDARQSNSEIGKKIKSSKEFVNYRIKRLIDEGIIKGFYTVIDTFKLGYLSCRFFVKLKNDTPKNEKEILDYFIRNSKYWWVDSISGFRNFGVVSWLKSIDDFQEEKEAFMKKFKNKIMEAQQSIYTRFYIYNREYLSNKKIRETKGFILKGSQEIKLENTDYNILKNIANNAKKPITEIAQELKTTSMVVMYRIKKMKEQKIILGFRAMIDLSKIGYYWYKIEFELEKYEVKKDLLSYFQVHPNIVYAYETIGGPDLEVELEVRSYEEFKSILDDIREKYGESIRNYEHMLWYKEHKLTFMPDI